MNWRHMHQGLIFCALMVISSTNVAQSLPCEAEYQAMYQDWRLPTRCGTLAPRRDASTDQWRLAITTKWDCPYVAKTLPIAEQSLRVTAPNAGEPVPECRQIIYKYQLAERGFMVCALRARAAQCAAGGRGTTPNVRRDSGDDNERPDPVEVERLRRERQQERIRLQQEREWEREQQELERQQREAAERDRNKMEIENRLWDAKNNQEAQDAIREGRRKKNLRDQQASHCLSLSRDPSLYGRFLNICPTEIAYVFCNYKSKKDSWAEAFDCEKGQYGLDLLKPGKAAAQHTNNSEKVYWAACNYPAAMPADAEFTPALGIAFRCNEWGL